MITTEWKIYDKGKIRIRAVYGFDKIGDHEPYFSITGETERRQSGRGRWINNSCGCIHDDIINHFPELTSLIKWHLAEVSSGPMHYMANAMYWWGKMMAGETDTHHSPWDAFRSTIVLGALADDSIGQAVWMIDGPDGEAMVRKALEERLPALIKQFHREMTESGVEIPR